MKNFVLCVAGLCAVSAAHGETQLAVQPFANSSFLIDGAGAITSWGDGSASQLGNGAFYIPGQPIPTAVPFPSGVQGWKSVTANQTETLAIADNGQLYGWGFVGAPPYTNTYGVPSFPSLIPSPEGSGWTAVAAGLSAGVLNTWVGLSSSGTLWKNGWYGMTKYPAPPTGSRWVKVAIGSSQALALSDSGRLYQAAWSEIPLPAGATAWTNFACGQEMTPAKADDGNLYSWGENSDGELGVGVFWPYFWTNAPQRVLRPTEVTGWKAISCGIAHSLAIANDGSVYAWGGNWSGELGLGHSNKMASPTRVPGLSNVTAIAASQDFSLAVADCKVWGWGRNYAGQLGDGAICDHELSPVMSLISYDICSTNPPGLPVLSLTAPDDYAAETSYRDKPGHPYTNSARFMFSRTVATTSPLTINYSIGGTASNGWAYLPISSPVTIPANSNSISVLVVPTRVTLPESTNTITITLLSDPAYTFGTASNVTITLAQHEDQWFPPGALPLQIRVGASPTQQVFSIQASTNMKDWFFVATVTNQNGVVSFIETNRTLFKSRFFRAVPSP